MLYLYRSLGLAALISTLVATSPVDQHAHLDSRNEILELGKRQDANTDDIETDSNTDPLRDGKSIILYQVPTSLILPSAIDYASVFSAQATATYSAVSTGASPSDAVLASVTAVSPGTGAVGSPPDPKEQGDVYNVDHILELQFVVGAFQVNSRPYVQSFPETLGLIIWESEALLTPTTK